MVSDYNAGGSSLVTGAKDPAVEPGVVLRRDGPFVRGENVPLLGVCHPWRVAGLRIWRPNKASRCAEVRRA